MKSIIQFKRVKSSLLITLALACFGLLPETQAVVPPPDGGYPNFNTAEGTKALFSLTTGSANTAVGWYSLFSNTEGSFNTATGAGSLLFNTGNNNTAFGAAALLFNTTSFQNTAVGAAALLHNTTGIRNTANGDQALLSNTTGDNNTATGNSALFSNTTGDNNTATGAAALLFNTKGSFNTANGDQALASNTEGSFNTANGVNALLFNTTGDNNTATGNTALMSNTTGVFNTATGATALLSNTTGVLNTAIGVSALPNNTTGDNNTATGVNSLQGNTTGFQNTAIGGSALMSNATGFKNTAIGFQALLTNTGSGNTALGYLAGSNLTIGDDNICIGNVGVAGDGGTIRIGESFIGATYIAGITGQTASGGAAVFVNSEGKLGTSTSSARFKDEIQPMDKASEALFALQPVTFRYKKEIDPQGIPQFGLVAEDVEKVDPDLVVRDAEGKLNTVRYEQINAMLLNEFLKEHRTVRELKKEIAALTAIVKQQAAQIQKVSAEVEMSKCAPRVAQIP